MSAPSETVEESDLEKLVRAAVCSTPDIRSKADGGLRFVDPPGTFPKIQDYVKV